jgi:hypothetical protein
LSAPLQPLAWIWYLNAPQILLKDCCLKLRQMLDELQRQAQDEEGEMELTTPNLMGCRCTPPNGLEQCPGGVSLVVSAA